MDEDATDEVQRAIRCAVRLLARRDHSTFELRHKLDAREFSEQSIEAAVLDMTRHGYLDDERYATLFAEQRVAKGLGPRAIQAKMRERGLDGPLVKEAIDALGVDWQAVARDALRKRFGEHSGEPSDTVTDRDEEQRRRARMARFLASRGFSTSDSIRAIDEAGRSPVG